MALSFSALYQLVNVNLVSYVNVSLKTYDSLTLRTNKKHRRYDERSGGEISVWKSTEQLKTRKRTTPAGLTTRQRNCCERIVRTVHPIGYEQVHQYIYAGRSNHQFFNVCVFENMKIFGRVEVE